MPQEQHKPIQYKWVLTAVSISPCGTVCSHIPTRAVVGLVGLHCFLHN